MRKMQTNNSKTAGKAGIMQRKITTLRIRAMVWHAYKAEIPGSEHRK